MGIGCGAGVALEGVRASVAALGALDAISVLDREDAFLASGIAVGSGAALGSGVVIGPGVDVLQRRYEIRLERLGLTARLEAQLAAMKARDAAEAIGFQQAMTPPDASVQDRTYAEMSMVEEIAGVLTISSAAAGALVEQSRKICSLPPVFQALATGAMSWQHARIVADETEGLDPAGAAALVAHFFDPDAPHPARGATPGQLVPSRFRAKVRNWRERHHPETLQKRHAKGVTDRRMEYTPDRDGMAWISLYLPGDTACAIWNRTTATARGLQGPNEPRTITQLRPDIAASLLLSAGNTTGNTLTATGTTTAAEPASIDDGTGNDDVTGTDASSSAVTEIGKVPTPRADVLVMVPVFSLLGLTDEPAVLDGLGPIPASMARKLVADGADSFYRVLVDPRDGAPLEIGRKNYRLTETIKRWIRMRDGKCTFPGCTNRTPDNETDHLKAWEHGGTTGASNLAQLCPEHHRLKHHSQWTPDPATNNGSPGWTSPTGRHYKPEHPHPEPTHWPVEIHAQGRTDVPGGTFEPKTGVNLNGELLRVVGHRPDFHYLDWSPGEDALRRCLHSTK
ncbi:HNH endonuclease [Arthrobacter sp. FW306-05-C]|uniref:HNH endonuclease signature motif containing protein n=1 Tax=Arthrobacter sp. FW306-05-C TaxID=2879620 RepID=UPI001F2F5AA2|nr:HNH endonuclease signature motif containing protein [Arthrobacter sp. FW306-05-C]UKA65614.1 HNH endonuclease [Arthrobacter sp. FW306-05-C]